MWTMRDGTKIAIRDMTDSHLRNTLRMLIRNAERRLLGVAIAGNPFDGGPEGAEDAWNDGFDAMCALDPVSLASETWGPVFDRLEREADRRGLEWEDK